MNYQRTKELAGILAFVSGVGLAILLLTGIWTEQRMHFIDQRALATFAILFVSFLATLLILKITEPKN